MRLLVLMTILLVSVARADQLPTQWANDMLENYLRDPFSARYRDVLVPGADEGDYTVVCGRVNAKNSFGAYVGWRRFIALQNLRVLFEGSTDHYTSAPGLTPERKRANFEELWKGSCLQQPSAHVNRWLAGRQEPRQEGDLAVLVAQQRLADLGYSSGQADGLMGPMTKAAIEAFQRDHGLVPDGKLSEAVSDAIRVEWFRNQDSQLR